MQQNLSKAAHRLSGQPMFQILSDIKEMERAGEDVIHFEIGDPDFDTPGNIIAAAKNALDNGFTHYSDPVGDYDFRKAICQTRFFTTGFEPDIQQVLIAPGANMLIYYAVRCLVEEGEEVIIPDPSFSTYQSVLGFCNVKAVRVPLYEKNEFCLKAVDIEKKITEKTKLIIINSPHNPTGAVMEPDEMRKIGIMCLERGIYLYCDEIYSYLNYKDHPLYSPSVLDCCKERTIIATGFSKAFAMTGWRLGVAIAPSEVVRKMGLLLETTSSCVPSFIQKAGIEAITNGRQELDEMVRVYKERRDLLVEGLNSIDGIECVMPQGAFYAFPNIKKFGISSRLFAQQLLKTKYVGVCPGSDFGECSEGYIRLCYATSLDDIKCGLARLEEFVNTLR